MALGPIHGERIARVTIQNVAVLGAGLMGRGIAYVSALGGFRTILQDSSGPAEMQLLRQGNERADFAKLHAARLSPL